VIDVNDITNGTEITPGYMGAHFEACLREADALIEKRRLERLEALCFRAAMMLNAYREKARTHPELRGLATMGDRLLQDMRDAKIDPVATAEKALKGEANA
jgi:SpoVK/Ycf46/Vps4 family AAA+-type ATPase